ncbi:MAG: sigma factor [Lachnospiraceae bacterium]|nr:sigma factor [Lachnospiraceae bacterium]
MDFDFLLMKKVKNGNREASEQFIKKYYPVIYQYCFLHIHDRHDAEDMTQETFVRFFQSLQTYNERGKAKYYQNVWR